MSGGQIPDGASQDSEQRDSPSALPADQVAMQEHSISVGFAAEVAGSTADRTHEPNRTTGELPSTEPGFERLFDYFKHMTTLCLLTLGGVLSIGSQTGVTIEAVPMAVIVGLLAVGGIGAYSGMVEIIEAERRRERRPKRIAFYKGLSSFGSGMGTGAFLSSFLLSLFK